jgi:hypothetical protein
VYMWTVYMWTECLCALHASMCALAVVCNHVHFTSLRRAVREPFVRMQLG